MGKESVYNESLIRMTLPKVFLTKQLANLSALTLCGLLCFPVVVKGGLVVDLCCLPADRASKTCWDMLKQPTE